MMADGRHLTEPVFRCEKSMTTEELRLAYFHQLQDVILERLQITQPPETLTDADRIGLANAYLDIVSE